MIKEIINTFKHGDLKTKAALGLMIFGVFFSIGLFAYSIAVGDGTLTFISVVVLVVDVAYILTTDFSSKNIFVSNHKKKEKQPHEKKEKENTVKENKRKEKHMSADDPDDSEDEDKKNRKRKIREKDDEQEEDDDELGALQWVSSKKEKKKTEAKDEDKEKDREQDKEKKRNFDKYDNKSLKRVMVEYKVKKEHVMILVDSCRSLDISECPAFLWKDNQFAYILLLEEEPRVVKFSLYECNELKIQNGVPCKPSEEYRAFKEVTMVGKLFESLLPNYTKSEDFTHRTVFKKNLYAIGPDVYCTSASVKNILKVLSVNLVLVDSKINAGSYGRYFKQVYIAGLMYRDNVFNAGEYKDRVLYILNSMAEDADEDEFSDNISQMLLGGLIPQGYADYATQRAMKRKDK